MAVEVTVYINKVCLTESLTLKRKYISISLCVNCQNHSLNSPHFAALDTKTPCPKGPLNKLSFKYFQKSLVKITAIRERESK